MTEIDNRKMWLSILENPCEGNMIDLIRGVVVSALKDQGLEYYNGDFRKIEVTPKFKARDVIRSKKSESLYVIRSAKDGCYKVDGGFISWRDQDLYELVYSDKIQWNGSNLSEVLEYVGRYHRWGEWFKTWDEYEKYVRDHDSIFKIFCEDGSHYEVYVGCWIERKNGVSLPITEGKYKLIKPKDEELTDFEKMLSEIIGYGISASVTTPKADIREFAKGYAPTLLAAARKQFMEEDGLMPSAPNYNFDVVGLERVLDEFFVNRCDAFRMREPKEVKKKQLADYAERIRNVVAKEVDDLTKKGILTINQMSYNIGYEEGRQYEVSRTK